MVDKKRGEGNRERWREKKKERGRKEERNRERKKERERRGCLLERALAI
jgi:hypothetical protein